MADRWGSGLGDTERPETSAVLPTVREVLRLDPIAAALPELVTGGSSSGNLVRWVHVAETADAARLVAGGELLLATGVGWPTEPKSLRTLGRQLIDARIAGLVLELGGPMPAAPEPLVAEFRDANLPFVVLHREARFVAITEAVHSRIIDDQMVALRARDDIHALFTDLSLRGSPADYIVEQAAQALGSPVVLEDTGHRVIAAAGLGHSAIAGRDALLDRWEEQSRVTRRLQTEGWVFVPVEARGTRWGYLVGLPGDPHPAGRSNVLEQAAMALALSRLADRDDLEWTRGSHRSLLHGLVGRRFSNIRDVSARFDAAGFRMSNRNLVGMAVRLDSGTLPASAATNAAETARQAGIDAVAGPHPDQVGTLLVAVSAPESRQLTNGVFEAIAKAVGSSSQDDPAVVAAVGSETNGMAGLLSSLEEAVALAAGSEPTSGGFRVGASVVVRRVEQRPMLRLVSALGADPRLLEHSENMLRPLIEHDLGTGSDLMQVLRAYLNHPGNRTRAAAASHLSRSVFYQRIALIEDLLGMDLQDGEATAALHAAILTRARSHK